MSSLDDYVDQKAEAVSEHAPHALLAKGKILGEDFEERMSRFGLLVENANGNWDLSDRDMNALRTASALIKGLRAQRDSAWNEAVEACAQVALDLEIVEGGGYYSQADRRATAELLIKELRSLARPAGTKEQT